MASKYASIANEDRRGSRGEKVDIPFLVLVLLLLLVGLVVLYSASFAQSEYDTGYVSSTKYLQKQALCAAIGLGAMYAFSRIPASVWYRAAWPLYGVSIALLLSVLVIGEEVNGAKRWINIAGIQFQPSEVAKFTMILLFARLTRVFGEDAKQFRYGVLGFGLALLGILVPLALEKHLSAIMLMGMVAVVMMYVAGTSPKWLLAGAGAAALLFWCISPLWAMPVTGSRPGSTRRQTREIRGIRSYSPFTPSAPAACSAWGWANPDRNICICLFSTTIIFSRCSARSWDSSERCWSWPCSP